MLWRRELGDVLRQRRGELGRTLRQVASSAAVSPGYLSEIERGKKEASSEMLVTICAALGLTMSGLLRTVADRFARVEPIASPSPLPWPAQPVPLAPHSTDSEVSASAA